MRDRQKGKLFLRYAVAVTPPPTILWGRIEYLSSCVIDRATGVPPSEAHHIDCRAIGVEKIVLTIERRACSVGMFWYRLPINRVHAPR
jgi:hypothetical protein